MKNRHMVDLFRQDPERFSRFSVTFKDILVDYSKNIVTKETFRLLFGLARECKLKEAIKKMWHAFSFLWSQTFYPRGLDSGWSLSR